jgi:hypothetical protein
MALAHKELDCVTKPVGFTEIPRLLGVGFEIPQLPLFVSEVAPGVRSRRASRQAPSEVFLASEFVIL